MHVATQKVVPIRPVLQRVTPGVFVLRLELNRCSRCNRIIVNRRGHSCPPPPAAAMALAA